MNQDLSMYRPAAFSIIYGLENTESRYLPRFLTACLKERHPITDKFHYSME